jgi:hypothetical protein
MMHAGRNARAIRDAAEDARAGAAYDEWAIGRAHRVHAARRCLESVDLPGDTAVAVLRAVGDAEERTAHDAGHIFCRATNEHVRAYAAQLVRDARDSGGYVYYAEHDEEAWLDPDEIRAAVVSDAIDHGMELSRVFRSHALAHRAGPGQPRSLYPDCIDRREADWRDSFADCARLAMAQHWPELLDGDEDEDEDLEDEVDVADEAEPDEENDV